MVNSEPPIPIPFTTSGGSKNHFPLCKPPPKKKIQKPFFHQFRTSSSKRYSGKTVMKFIKMKDLFIQNGPGNKILFQFSHKGIFEPYFSVFQIFLLRHVFAGRIPASWRGISKNKRGFCSRKILLQQPPPIL
jgi:hypothetical protein